MTNASTKEAHFRSFQTRQTRGHMLRRLKEDGNERYRKLDCPWWRDPSGEIGIAWQAHVDTGCCLRLFTPEHT
jgi:hypothetical protein